MKFLCGQLSKPQARHIPSAIPATVLQFEINAMNAFTRRENQENKKDHPQIKSSGCHIISLPPFANPLIPPLPLN